MPSYPLNVCWDEVDAVDQHKHIFITVSEIPIPYALFCVCFQIYGKEQKFLFFFKLVFLIFWGCSSRGAFDERCNMDL